MCSSGHRSSETVGWWTLAEGRRLARGLALSPVVEVRVSPPENCFENIGANLCNLVHFGVKLDILIHTPGNKCAYQLLTYHLPQTLTSPVVGVWMSPPENLT